MSAKKEKTFGSRLANAKELADHMGTVAKYRPARPQESITAFRQLTQNIEAANTAVITANTSYLHLADERQAAIKKMKSYLPLINATLRGKFGRDSREVNTVQDLVDQIRGLKPVIVKTEGKDGEALEREISQSQTSFGSQIKHYKDIVDFLETLGTDYDPVNETIVLSELKTLYTTLDNLHLAVESSARALIAERFNRNGLYSTLKESAGRIKETLKSFGLQSLEYKLVSKMKF